MTSIPELLQAAGAWCRAGQLGPAEQAYRLVLELDPSQAEALGQLGLLAFHGGRMETAVDYWRRSADAQPWDAEARNRLGVALAGLGRATDAETAFREAMRLMPDSAEIHNNLGSSLRDQGRIPEAEAEYRAALRLQPTYADAHANLGNALCEQGRLAEGESEYRAALGLRPGPASWHNKLGLALLAQGRLTEAEASIRESVRLKPDAVESHSSLGAVLQGQGRLEEAEAAFREALRLKPDVAEVHSNLGSILCARGRPVEAETACREALRLRPDFAEASTNLGEALRLQGRFVEAEAACRAALERKPDSVEAQFNLGGALNAQGRRAEAETAYRTVLRHRPEFAAAHSNLGFVLLTQGQFTEGWAEYEWRFRAHGEEPPNPGGPVWDGSPLGAGALLLDTEQGLGDLLQFVRYAALVQGRAGSVVLECPKALVPLLSSCPDLDQLVAQGSPRPSFAAHCPLLSLPHLLGTTLETIPSTVPYLSADAELVRQWRKRLRPLTGFRVGIAWQGNPNHPDKQRFMPLASFAPLAAVPGVRLVSLQKGAGSEQLAEAGLEVFDLGPGVDEAAGTFMDTAAVMKNLDLVISADTAVAHLAGALGVPTWVALSYAADWRWLTDRDDNPWYPTLRLFRQERPGDWQTVFPRMADELGRRLASATGEGGLS